MSFTNDWNSYFSGTKEGDVVDLGGGAKVTRMGDGSAVYQDAGGAWVPYTQNSNPLHVAQQAQGLSNNWQQQYQTPTLAPYGPQTQLDPAAMGFSYNAQGQVTRAGSDPNAAANTMNGAYTFGQSVNDVKSQAAQAYYKANPNAFYNVLATGNNPDEYYQRVYVGDGTGGGNYGGASGGGNYGSGSSYGSSSSGGGQNPYLAQMGQVITGQITDNLQRNIMPQISSGAMSTGGYGGSRQGVVEANALNDANRQASNALTAAYFGEYDSSQNRDLQRYGMDQNYNLGMTNSENNFYTAQRGQDLQSTSLGAQLMNMGNTGYLNQGQGVYNIGNSYQQAPWTTMGNYGNTMNPYTGFGSQSSSSGGGASGALGGALGAARLWSMFSE